MKEVRVYTVGVLLMNRFAVVSTRKRGVSMVGHEIH